MVVNVVLVELNNENVTSSGLLFSEKFVLITGHVLLPYLKQFDLERWLQCHTPGILHYNLFKNSIGAKLSITIQNNGISTKSADVFAGFICPNSKKSCQKHLNNWAIEFENNTYHTKQLLSLFFILVITENGYEKSFDDVKIDLKQAIYKLLCNARQIVLNTGQEIFIESVPFGNRLFLNSYSRGIISNIVGENSCFLLSDCPSAPGSEGSPAFITTLCNRKLPIAIVISCVNWWKGEWVGLTLMANLAPLLAQFNDPLLYNNKILERILGISSKLKGAISNSLVQVTNKSLWGTAILINKYQGIFLTNSHVIETNRVMLHWQGHQFEATLIYQTPNSNVYDLAVLQCEPSEIIGLRMEPAEISQMPVRVGEDVFSAGYPLFQSVLNPQPTITKGSISQISKGMVHTTCCVLSGVSGGAILRSNGQLVAIVVSNVKMNETDIVYPRVNMAIPIINISSIIQNFIDSGDVQKLHSLLCRDSEIIREWNYLSSKL